MLKIGWVTEAMRQQCTQIRSDWLGRAIIYTQMGDGTCHVHETFATEAEAAEILMLATLSPPLFLH